MTEDEKIKVKWFKKELESTMNQEPIRQGLREKIMLLSRQFETHSKQFGTLQYSSENLDERLAGYITKKSEYDDELQLLILQEARVQSILNYMPLWIKEDLININLGKRKYSELSEELGYSETGLKKLFDEEILKAVNKYENKA